MKKFVLSCSLALACTAAWADHPNIKPGLWEIQHQGQMNGKQMPDMQKMMANMPPEAQEHMKQMMAQKAGMGMSANGGIKVCMTPEQVSRGEVGNQDAEHHCKMTDMHTDGKVTTIKAHCDAPQSSDMTTEMTHISETEWKSVSHMTSGTHTMDMTSTGKWLGADCGDIKPLSEAAKDAAKMAPSAK